ncbi:glycosyltransferase family 2 protein [Marisediminicola sp. LYQ134]|uniref:glycosyltransferase family 2 protein n=1 Tax=Marisediminicola sp. LYQ134 TaxID=3391061 RepID=UPI003982E234
MTAPPYGVSVAGNAWNTLDGEGRDTPVTVTVVVAHFEQPVQLRRVLLALDRQSHPADHLEIIVVDDGSAVAPTVPPHVTLVRQADEGFRLAAARNRGIEAATGDVLLFLDADTVPEPAYVERMARLPSLAPEAVVVGTRLHADLSDVPIDAPIEVHAPRHRLPDPDWLRDEYRRSDDLLHADDRSYRHLIGAVLACSRWFALEVGGFDESFTTYGGEDWEWAWRCWIAGAIFAHAPGAVAWHDGADWSGRASDPDDKSRETHTLAHLIPVRGSRPHGLLLGSSDTLVVVDSGMTASHALITVDSVLRAAPFAHVRVSRDHERLFAADPRVSFGEAVDPSRAALEGYRVRVDIAVPCRIAPPGTGGSTAFGRIIETIGTGTTGRVTLADDDGALVVIRSARAAAREARWPTPFFEHTVESAASVVRRLRGDESVAAHYGDWL